MALTLPAAPAAARKPANPCLDPAKRERLLCPDLIMKRPFGLSLDRSVRPGRQILRAGNSIDNIGRGPAELRGVRSSRYFMRARQRIYRKGPGRISIKTGARLFFKYISGQRRYWKFDHAARFELWRIDALGRRTRRVKVGPKVSYCLRDLRRTRPGRRFSPRRLAYPACSVNSGQRRVTLGTSVGWSDIYPPTYPEQWLDVTGFRGCFAFRHVADPRNGIYESKETNNSASVAVRLPFRPGNQRCPGVRSPAPDPTPAPPATPYPY